MPPHDPGADREAELAALQTAFDEYIASSRELEDELDAELAKMRKFLYQRFCGKTQCRLPHSYELVWCWESSGIGLLVSSDSH